MVLHFYDINTPTDKNEHKFDFILSMISVLYLLQRQQQQPNPDYNLLKFQHIINILQITEEKKKKWNDMKLLSI